MNEKDILFRKGKEIKIVPVVDWILEMDSNTSYYVNSRNSSF